METMQHLHWRASVGGKEKEWDAEITEQVPDRVIAWRQDGGRLQGVHRAARPRDGRVAERSARRPQGELTAG
jgi:uncharacterized membrane protein